MEKHNLNEEYVETLLNQRRSRCALRMAQVFWPTSLVQKGNIQYVR